MTYCRFVWVNKIFALVWFKKGELWHYVPPGVPSKDPKPMSTWHPRVSRPKLTLYLLYRSLQNPGRWSMWLCAGSTHRGEEFASLGSYIPGADAKRRVSVEDCSPRKFMDPHDVDDMPSFLPAGLTQCQGCMSLSIVRPRPTRTKLQRETCSFRYVVERSKLLQGNGPFAAVVALFPSCT